MYDKSELGKYYFKDINDKDSIVAQSILYAVSLRLHIGAISHGQLWIDDLKVRAMPVCAR